MDELPQPDLRDHRGRFHRILISLALGVAFAALGWWFVYTVVGAGNDYEHYDHGARKFVWFVSAASGAFGYQLGFFVLSRRAKRQWEAERFPKAQIKPSIKKG
jgi:hypothetical protein